MVHTERNITEGNHFNLVQVVQVRDERVDEGELAAVAGTAVAVQDGRNTDREKEARLEDTAGHE